LTGLKQDGIGVASMIPATPLIFSRQTEWEIEEANLPIHRQAAAGATLKVSAFNPNRTFGAD
jgi:hypothetical protein